MYAAARARAARARFRDTEMPELYVDSACVHVTEPTVFEVDYSFKMLPDAESLGPASNARASPPAPPASCDAMRSAMCDYVIDLMQAFDSCDDYHGKLRLIAVVHPKPVGGATAWDNVATVRVYRKLFKVPPC